MITAVIRGGLGNQLFQYAAAYSLSRRLMQPITLDISFFSKQTLRAYKLDKLNIAPHNLSYGENADFLQRAYTNRNINGIIRRMPFRTLPISEGKYLVDHFRSYTPLFHTITGKNIFLNGYFQSNEYFECVRRDLLEQFKPKYVQPESCQIEMDRIEGSASVAVHIRRGDFVEGKGTGYHYTLGISYYMKAIDMIKEKVKFPEFFYFSDDMGWVKNHFGGENDHYVTMRTENLDVDELMLMRSCKHIITANSTFSWWAAWLNEHEDAMRIVPGKAYGNEHMIPKTWIKIPVE